MALDGVAVAGQDGALGWQFALEDVADRVEGGVVRTRDDELREERRGERGERDLRLPRPALDREACAPWASSGGSGEGGIERRADRCEEAAQERLGVVARARRVERFAFGGEGVDRGIARGDRASPGGSITVSEPISSGRAAAASSETTPPYE